MSTEAEIKQSIRNDLAILFGDSEPTDLRVFREKYNRLVEYATAVSAPFLGPETIRYQSMLLYVSVLFLSISLFKLGGIKVFDTVLSVDHKLLVAYEVFIGMVIVIFLVKAYVDYLRARFTRSRNAGVGSELAALMSAGLVKRHIQHYFWLEIFDAIGRAYKAYDDALSAVANKPSEFTHRPVQTLTLDKTGFSKNLEAIAEIEKHEAFLAGLIRELAGDENRFRDAAELILNVARSQPEDEFAVPSESGYEKIRRAYEQHLSKWLNARNALNDAFFSSRNDWPDNQRAEAAAQIVERIATIRRVYVVLEVVAPVAFAIFAILYVRLK
jgi:hypothetical protein